MQPLPQAALAVLVAAVLAWFGAKKRSLSREGAVAAFVVGLISFAASIRSGALLIAFYQSGSSLTKFKAARKATLDASSSDASDGRGAAQVLACSLLAALPRALTGAASIAAIAASTRAAPPAVREVSIIVGLSASSRSIRW